MLQNIVIFAACECRRFGAITSSFPFTLSKVASVTFLFFLIQPLLFHSFASPLQKRNHSLVFVYYIALLTLCMMQRANSYASSRQEEEKKRKQGRKNKTPTCENPHRSLCKESNNFSKHKKS